MEANKKTIGIVVIAAALALVACASRQGGQQSFSTPEAAFEALVVAVEKAEPNSGAKLLGPGVENLLDSGDAVQDKLDRAAFVTAYRDKHSLESPDGNTRTLVYGNNDSVLPIPAVKRDGKWILDGNAGADELVYRRVGANELGAIGVMEGYVDAQNEYAAKGHDGDPAGIYALKLVSDPGLENGLYWETAEGAEPSPAGEFVAAAASEGYRSSTGGPTYHGYRYRMLYRQGEHANGGARDYFNNGVMSNGFALLAWPADYESSGVMTFIVNPDGVVFQRDLGADTENAVKEITTFDPDSTWTAIADTEGK
jgi:Protein of unknown function (DUF2950)